MASDDVIELGSSDEDTEPAPKRRKPPLNAMVHIPNKLTELTIKPATRDTKINPACIARGAIGKAITVTKVPKNNVNPYSNIKKVNGKPIKAVRAATKNAITPITGIPVAKSPIMFSGINPLNKIAMKGQLSKSNISIATGGNSLRMLNVGKPIINKPVRFGNNMKATKGLINNKNIPFLPPGITVKKTGALQSIAGDKIKKRPLTVHKMIKPSVITTVDLDDDEPASTSASGLQWYVRPEDQKESAQKDSPQKESPEKESPQIVSSTLEDPLQDDVLTDVSAETVEKDKITLPIISQNTKTEKKLTKSPDETLEKSPLPPEVSQLEQQNNEEPDKSKYIEITIDDSPLKPPQNKKGFKVGAELAIIIEDSPVKNTTVKPDSICGSDNETAASPKDSHSKKKLEYPKGIDNFQTIEIELELLPEEENKNIKETDIVTDTTQNKAAINSPDKIAKKTETETSKTEKYIEKHHTEKARKISESCEIVLIEESPVKLTEPEHPTTPKKPCHKTKSVKMVEIETEFLTDKEKEEFHPMYQNFINLCFHLENSDDMTKIVEKKIKSYYRQVPKDYTESEAFIDMVSSKIMAMKAGPEKMYLYIKDIVDELNLQRKLAKAQPVVKVTKNEEQEKFLYGEDSEFDSKRQRQIRKLEKTLKKLHRAIQKLEEQEVDFDDEEDSVYLLTDSEDVNPTKDDIPVDKEVLLQRYKERMVRVHAKLCQLTNTKMPSETRVQIDARPGQPKGPAKRLEKWINRKVPIGTPLPFPDFHDVLRCVRDANQDDKLGWNEADIMEEARDLFTRCGKKLQRRRQENEWRLAASRIPADVADPAEESDDLKRKLEENKRSAAKRETEVLNKYADRQNQLNLEAVEIGDKEAEESPVESDDDEPVEDNTSLTSKEQRKERLKRLLQEKSKKASDEKENNSENSPMEIEFTQTEDSVPKVSNDAEINIKDTDDKLVNTTIDEPEQEDLSEPRAPNSVPINSDLHGKDKNVSEDNSRSMNKDDNTQLSDKVHSLSDDSNKLESDIDELHLLQKLYSENELNTSVMDSSDSGTPIAISDSSANEISSDEQRNKKSSSDVISIENSSYSESEEKKGYISKDPETDAVCIKEAIKANVDADMEIECSNDGIDKKNNKSNSRDNRKSLEDILLASSDEAEDTELQNENKSDGNTNAETCINLRDDSISIGETVIEESRSHEDYSGKNANTDASSVEGMEIGPQTNSEEQNVLEENVVETESIKSSDEGSVTEISSVKSTEVIEEENAIETTSIKSIETLNGGDSNEATSVKSVETVEDANIDENSSIKSVETIADAHVNETSSIKSVEPIEDGNLTETNVKSVESIETTNDYETSSIKSVESVKITNANETSSIKSVETVEDADINETEGNVNETSSIKSVETVDDADINESEGNVNETSSIKSVETVEDADSNELANSFQTGDQSCLTSIKAAIAIEDVTDNVENSMNKAVAMDTDDVAENDDILSEPMDVDSNVEHT